MAFNRSHGGWFHWEICVTVKNWLIDLYLTVLHGRWEVKRVERSALALFDDFSVQLKKEGTEVCYDPSVVCDYYAVNRRTGDEVLCGSRRECEGYCAVFNDAR